MIITSKSMRYLKNTPTGTWGILPEEGFRWFHPKATPTCGEEIIVDFGHECMVIGKTKKSWTRAMMTGFDDYSREKVKSRCSDKLAAVR